MVATLLVLLSALTHAVWNAILKRQKETAVAAVCILAVAGLCATLAAFLVRAAAFPTAQGLVWAVAAGLAEAGYFVTLARALERAPLGAAYTIARGGSILIVWPLSVLFLSEHCSATGVAGSVIVLVGLVATGFSRSGRPGSRAASVERVRARSGLIYSVICATFVAFVYLAYKRALDGGAEQTALFAVSLLIALPVNVVALGPGGPRRMVSQLRANPAALLVAGVVCCASFLIFLDALRASGAGRVLTLRNTSVIFAQGLGWAMGERPGWLPLVGVGVVAVGAVVLGGA